MIILGIRTFDQVEQRCKQILSLPFLLSAWSFKKTETVVVWSLEITVANLASSCLATRATPMLTVKLEVYAPLSVSSKKIPKPGSFTSELIYAALRLLPPLHCIAFIHSAHRPRSEAPIYRRGRNSQSTHENGNENGWISHIHMRIKSTQHWNARLWSTTQVISGTNFRAAAKCFLLPQHQVIIFLITVVLNTGRDCWDRSVPGIILKKSATPCGALKNAQFPTAFTLTARTFNNALF